MPNPNYDAQPGEALDQFNRRSGPIERWQADNTIYVR